MNHESKDLDPFERWMVKSNLEYVAAEGIEVVVTRLRARGYDRVADAVQQTATDNANKGNR